MDNTLIEKAKAAAEQNYAGGAYCGEAVLLSLREVLGLNIGDDAIAMASGISGGFGSGCVCGAVNAAVMAIGHEFGRSVCNNHMDPDALKCIGLGAEMQQWFVGSNGKNSSCCRVLTKGMDMSKGENFPQCVKFSGMCAAKAAEIILREKEAKAAE